MLDFIYHFFSDTCGLDGILLRAVTSFCFTSIIFFSVIIVGWLINCLENLQIKLLSKFVKHSTAVTICNYATFPGVCLHEMAHATMAWITGASVEKICFFELGENGRLGYVSYSTRGSKIQQRFQIAMTSCAPVIFGFLFLFCLIFLLCCTDMPLISKVAGWYLAVSVLDHMSMSGVDIKYYVKSVLVLFPLVFIICYMITLFMFR